MHTPLVHNEGSAAVAASDGAEKSLKLIKQDLITC
jgi:hypothetical protein